MSDQHQGNGFPEHPPAGEDAPRGRAAQPRGRRGAMMLDRLRLCRVRLRPRAPVGRASLVLVIALVIVTGAFAYFSSSGSGSAHASVGTLAAPSITSSTPGAGTVALSWSSVSAPSGSGLVKYYVTRNGGAPAGNCPTSTSPTTATSCTDSGLVAGNYTYTVTAVWQSWTASSSSASVTVSSGALDHFSISAPASSTAGGVFSVTVTAQDAANITVTGYMGTIHFSSSDGQAVLPANYTFVSGDHGSHTFNRAVTLNTPGNQSVSVNDTVQTSVTGSATVSVGPPPTVTSTSPSSGDQGGSNFNVTINGSGFENGASASFSNTGITVNSTTFVSSTRLIANIAISAFASTGPGTVTITNPDNSTASLASGFTVNGPPTASSTSPSSGDQGASNFNVTINGTNFENGASASFSGTGITVNSTTYVSATQMIANITIAGSAATGARTVTITNPDHTTASVTSGFTVNAAPTVTSTSPSSGDQGASNFNVTINGTGFDAGTQLASSFGAGITVNSTTYVSASQLTANITISGSATTGTRTVSITNGDGSTASLANGFTVNTGPGVTSASPNTLPQGKSNQNITITGTNFVSGATASFSSSGITVNSTTYNSATSLTANITISSSATLGSSNVTVTNPDGGSGTASAAFTVTATPTVTSINPGSMVRSATSQNVTITGTNFVSGATASFSSSGITVNSTTYNSATSLTANITISSTATLGGSTVTITNPGGGAGSCSSCFYVYSFSQAASGSATTGTTVTSSSLTISAGTSYLIFAASNSSSGDTATASTSSFTSSPTITAIGSSQDYDGSADHDWAWYLTGGSGSGTIEITFTKSTTDAYLEVVALGGASISSPVVSATEGTAVSGGAASSTTTSSTATAALTGSPATTDAEVVFLSANKDLSPRGPTDSSSTITALSSAYLHNPQGSADVFAGAPASTSAVTLTLSKALNWGTLAVEIAHP